MDHFVHVVDDEQAARWSASFLLSTLGLRCFEYQSGRHFLEEVTKAPPGCVLLDVLMPGLSGLDVQAALIARSIHWPVIFVSGQEATSLVVTAVQRGAVDYIHKPYSEEQLLCALHRAFVHMRESVPANDGQQQLGVSAASGTRSARTCRPGHPRDDRIVNSPL